MLAVRGTAKEDRRSVASVLWGAAVLFVLAALYLVPFVLPFIDSASAIASEALEVDQEECGADESSQDDGSTSGFPDFVAQAPARYVMVTHPAAIQWVVESMVAVSVAVAVEPSLRTAPKTSPPL